MELANKIICGDALEMLKTLPADSARICVTSPPYYGLRDYLVDGQIGLEISPESYVERLVEVFRELRRVLRPDGTLWLNIGDSYAGSGKGASRSLSNNRSKKNTYVYTACNPAAQMPKTFPNAKNKDLLGIPWMLAFALRKDGWYLRSDIIWHKPNAMPESVKDRPTKSYEHLFLLAKSERYYYNGDAIKEPCVGTSIQDFIHRKNLHNKSKGDGSYEKIRSDLCRSRDHYMPKDFKRNKRDVWTVATKPYCGAHFAVFPLELIQPCILAGSQPGDIVIDPFFGSGTTGISAVSLNRYYIGIDLNPTYCQLARERISVSENKNNAARQQGTNYEY